MNRSILIIIVGVLCLGGNWLFSFYRGIPLPCIQDEYSYLLAADTFAHGRVTNAAHPLWQSFESFHVLMQPTYMSKYPPAQGFFMAVGQAVFGHPIYGVWLSASLMCMAICWMLYAWVPAQWVFWGGLAGLLQFGMFNYWSQSYWGGAVAALGGALVFGALPRIFKYQRLRDVIWLGLGLAVLVNSRPLEGLLMAIPLGCLILPWQIKWETVRDVKFVKKVILPFTLTVLVIIIGVGSYNKAVTGNAAVFPYILYSKEYMVTPLFIWEPLRPMPALRHQAFRYLEENVKISNHYKKTWGGFWKKEFEDIGRMFGFYFKYVLAVPILCFLPWALSDRGRALKYLGVVLILACTCAAMPWEVRAHYLSPVTSLAVLLVVMGLRVLVSLNRQIGTILLYVLISLQVMTDTVICSQSPRVESYGTLAQSQGPAGQVYTREQFKEMLTQKGGKHLVLIKDDRDLILLNDWVYNGANIDQQPIVWARSMNGQQDAKLEAYFKDRRVWNVSVNYEVYGHELAR